MTKVKDLIKYSEFIKAEGFDDLKPEITIPLPTYSRGDNGLFKMCVESLLNQTFTNFELIIIDDGSTDSTFSQIQEFMKKDSRIAVIRHKKNVGLPAVSELEAYFRARSSKFFYAFDDNEFTPDAIELLYTSMKNNPDIKIIHGISELKFPDESMFVGAKDFDYDELKKANHIPNSPLLLDKSVIEKVGFYDPHVAIARICDWDLWLRTWLCFTIYKLKEILVLEKGVSESDSLCNSYLLSEELAREWVDNLKRNEKLKLENILEYEVDDKPVELSQGSKNIIDFILKKKFPNHFWRKNSNNNEVKNKDSSQILITAQKKFITVLIHIESSSTGIVFNTLPKETRDKIQLKTYFEFENDIHNILSESKALIFTREITNKAIIYAKVCAALKIPYYYFTDDNLFELGFVEKSDENINLMQSFKGCILSSNTLIDYFKENNLNDNFYFVAPAISEEQKKDLVINLDKYNNPKQINFLYASNNRFDGLLELSNVFIKLAKEYSVKFFIFKKDCQQNEQIEFHNICSKNNIEIEYLDVCYDHQFFIKKIAPLNIHFILHPRSNIDKSFHLNYKNKTLNFLINAYLSSSLIFASDLEPYSRLKQEGMLGNLIYNNPDEVYSKVKEFLNNQKFVQDVFGELETYCLTNFDAKKNAEIFEEILNNTL